IGIKATASGIVVIGCEDHDKKIAADMANFLVAELDRFNREVFNTKGKRSRQFLEARLGEVQSKMRKAENDITAYERANKVVISTDDAAVRGLGDAMARKLSLQVQRSY